MLKALGNMVDSNFATRSSPVCIIDYNSAGVVVRGHKPLTGGEDGGQK